MWFKYKMFAFSVTYKSPKFNYSNKFWFSDFAETVLGFLYPFLEPS